MSVISNVFSAIERQLRNINVEQDTVSKAPSGDIIPGDIEIVSLVLISEDQQRRYNLLAQCRGIDIYESIMCPVMFADLYIADSIGLHQSFPIIGEEYVSMTFRTPGTQGEPASYMFHVNRVADKVIAENNMMSTYRLQLVSIELIRNSQGMITKTYNQEITSLVSDILQQDLGTQKPIHVDRTIGIEQGNITRMRPLVAIDYLRQKAVSAEQQSQSWVFFESRKGFFFTTIERLIDAGNRLHTQGRTDKQFFFDMSRKDGVGDVTIRNVLSYNQLSFADTISKITNGALYNEVSSFNVVTGGITKSSYRSSDDGTEFKTLDGSSSRPVNTPSFKALHGHAPAVTRFIPTTSDRPTTYVAEKLNVLGPYMTSLSQNITQVMVYGDSEINIGDVIQCSFPSATSAQNDSGVSRLDSGLYLVSKIRHIISNTDRPQHGMALELLKGNFTETA